MTKKDYIALAKVIKANTASVYMPKDVPWNGFINDLCKYLKSDNPLFDEAKFRKAIN